MLVKGALGLNVSNSIDLLQLSAPVMVVQAAFNPISAWSVHFRTSSQRPEIAQVSFAT